jgi:hypothetical protein
MIAKVICAHFGRSKSSDYIGNRNLPERREITFYKAMLLNVTTTVLNLL